MAEHHPPERIVSEPLSALLVRWLCDYAGGRALSPRFKGAFRVALAMVITYGISLAMDWDKAFWAALSVIFCSLATSGQSINASLDRIAGTALASALALILVALFPQDRWLFLIGVSTVIAICSYHMTGFTPRQAIWFNAGFNLPIIAILGESGNLLAPTTFDIAILRTQQTALGAIVYSLVAMLIWPQRGDQQFVSTVRAMCQAQQRLFKDYAARCCATGTADDTDTKPADLAGQLRALRSKFEGAAYDNADLRLMAGAWNRLLYQLDTLHGVFERQHTDADELKGIELYRLIPGIEQRVAEIDACFAQVALMLSGQPAGQCAAPTPLNIDQAAWAELSTLQHASVISVLDTLDAVAAHAYALVENTRQIYSTTPASAVTEMPATATKPWAIDPDRLNTALRQTTALWLAFLSIIYIEGMPIPVAIVALANAFSMVLATLPHVPANIMYKPVLQGGLFGGTFYMLVMPHLTEFWEFGVCLFIAIFAVAYLFHTMQTALARGLWMTMLVLIMGADNEQTFSFLVFANWSLTGLIFVSLMVIAWYFPISFRPTAQLRAQLRRYWSSAAFLLGTMSRTGSSTWLFRTRQAFYYQQVLKLPARLRTWVSALPEDALDNRSRTHLLALFSAIQSTSHRLLQLHDTASTPEQAHQVTRLGDELYAAAAALIAQLVEPTAINAIKSAQQKLAQDAQHALQAAETWIAEHQPPPEEARALYRLLHEQRGLIRAINRIVAELEQIDWKRLYETRF